MIRYKGKHYKTFKGAMGKRYFVEMTKEEVREVRLYWATLILIPVVFIYGGAALVGMI